MRRIRLRALLLSSVLLAAMAAAADAPRLPTATETRTATVEKPSHGAPFEYRIKLEEQTAHYTVYRLTYPTPKHRELFGDISASYYVPADLAAAERPLPPRPAAVVLHILGGNGALSNMFCANLASTGIPAVMFHMPLFSTRTPGGSRNRMLRRPDALYLLGEAMQLSLLEIARTVDVMQSRPEVNGTRISLLGTSMGGLFAASAAARDERIDKAIILLAGGDLARIIGHSKETMPMRRAIEAAAPEERRRFETVLADIDPLAHAARLRPRAAAGRILMLNAENDEVIPKAATLALAEAAGLGEQLRLIPGVGHYTAIAVLPQLLGEFVEFLRDDTVPPVRAAAVTDDQEVIRRVFGELGRLLRFNPEPGYAYFVEADFTVREKDVVSAKGSIALLRGDGRQFKLSLMPETLPVKIGSCSFGYDTAPWISTASGRVYRGILEPAGLAPADRLDFRVGMYRDMAVGLFDMAANGFLAPLKKWCAIELRRGEDGNRFIAVAVEKKPLFDLFLKPDGVTPERLIFNDKKFQAEIVFRNWTLRAPADPALFQPPEDGETVPVRESDLVGVMTAPVNFLVEGGLR